LLGRYRATSLVENGRVSHNVLRREVNRPVFSPNTHILILFMNHLEESHLSPHMFVVLCVLYRCGEGNVWVGALYDIRMGAGNGYGLDTGQVRKALKKLVARGYVTMEKARRGSRGYRIVTHQPPMP